MHPDERRSEMEADGCFDRLEAEQDEREWMDR
jgi:hypothetical protein